MSIDLLNSLKTKCCVLIEDILVQNSGLDLVNYNYNDNLRDDLGINSLNLTKIIMSLEELFDINIDDADVENILTINKIYEFVKSESPPERLEYINKHQNIPLLLKEVETFSTNTSHQIEKILTNTLFRSYLSELDINIKSLLGILRDLMRLRKIEDVSSLPIFNGEKKIKEVHIIFIGRVTIFYLNLKSKTISYREIPISEFSTKLFFHIDSTGKLNSLDVATSLEEYDKDGKLIVYKSSFKGSTIEDTLRIISLINTYKETLNGK